MTTGAVRACPRCGRAMARLNPGPWCWPCQEDAPDEPMRRRARTRRTDPGKVAQVHQLAGQGVGAADIARCLGLPRSTVHSLLRRTAAPAPDASRR